MDLAIHCGLKDSNKEHDMVMECIRCLVDSFESYEEIWTQPRGSTMEKRYVHQDGKNCATWFSVNTLPTI